MRTCVYRQLGIRNAVRTACGWSVAVLCALSATLALSPATASAGITHKFLGSFGSFSMVRGLAVDESTGDVYVYDIGTGGGSVSKLNATGEPVEFSALKSDVIEGVGVGGGIDAAQIAVDNSSGPTKGDIYVANNDGVRIYDADGSFLGELGNRGSHQSDGVAVDNAGNVYVARLVAQSGNVDKYVPTANPVTEADYTASIAPLNEPYRVAVDPAGDLYIRFRVSELDGSVKKYDPSQFGSFTPQGTEVAETARSVAVDSSDGHVYVVKGGVLTGAANELVEFDSSSNQLGEPFGEGRFSESYALAVDGVHQRVFVANGNSE
ncbi:MAG TPA: hypothetical protein VGI76_01010, partial [Solirubrobacteraceae bacterium]